jgi:ABC-type transport system involved in cytochrome bd biosynthesis fused ATPase/permease subunit
MAPSKRFWFLRSWMAWLVLGMGVVTALVTSVPWIIALGVIGSLLVLLFEAGLDPGSLLRAAHLEQENRSMRAEHRRLVEGIKELQARQAAQEARNQALAKELEAARAEVERMRAKGP